MFEKYGDRRLSTFCNEYCEQLLIGSKYIVGQKSNDTSIHSWLPFNEKSTPGKNKDIQVYIRMSTKSDINLRMVTLMST